MLRYLDVGKGLSPHFNSPQENPAEAAHIQLRLALETCTK